MPLLPPLPVRTRAGRGEGSGVGVRRHQRAAPGCCCPRGPGVHEPLPKPLEEAGGASQCPSPLGVPCAF